MADLDISQEEADALIALGKQRIDDTDWAFPQPGEKIAIPLISLDKRERFMLDVSRARIKLTKASYQNRARQAIVLMRLCLDGAPHRNPDGVEISGPHLHLYRKGFEDKWAIPAPTDRYTQTDGLFSMFEAFMKHCNVTEPPRIQGGLF